MVDGRFEAWYELEGFLKVHYVKDTVTKREVPGTRSAVKAVVEEKVAAWNDAWAKQLVQAHVAEIRRQYDEYMKTVE